MNASTLLSCLPLWLPAGSPGQEAPPQLAPQEAEGLAVEYLAAVRGSCLPCHNPDSEDKKAIRDWANAEDLAGTLASEGLIAPGSPDDSDIWLVIDEEEMPPTDWEGEGLSDSEKQAIKGWIEAGAPLPPTEVPAAKTTDADDPAVGQSRVLKILGLFHPAMVHFPVALLLAAALAEFLSRLFPDSQTFLFGRRFCLLLGAVSILLAASTGWINGETALSSDRLVQHRWMGITCTVLAWLALIAERRRQKAPDSPGLARWAGPLIYLTALLVGATGHWGGMLTFGEGYFGF